ncbi:MAG: TonB-dependent receptor [Bryobacterales bacterium]|nr:TonB-dependent receptor [Bryobacterales bacterium]
MVVRFFTSHPIRLALAFTFAFSLGAQEPQPLSSITGRVRSAAGDPLRGIAITVQGLAISAETGADGAYSLSGLDPGEYTLVASGGGYVPREQGVTIPASGPPPVADFELDGMATSIDVVESLKEYHVEESSLATRTATRILDLPQSVQVFANQWIEDRAILEGNELYRNISGLNQSTYSAMVFRGFTQRELLFNGARGNPFGSLEGDVNNAGFSTSQIRLTNVQRVEVLKGPVASVYGAGEPGGLINYVTKQPTEVLDGELQFRIGSFGQRMANADFGGPVGKRVLLRGAFYLEDRDSFRANAGSLNSHAVADLVFKANERHRFALQGEFINQGLSAARLRGIPVDADGNWLTYIQWSGNEPTDKIKMIARVLQARGDHNFQSGWDVSYTFRVLGFENNDNCHEPRGFNPPTAAGRTIRREYRDFYRSNDDWSGVGYASRSVMTGTVRHRILFGTEYFAQDHVFRSRRAREQEVGGPVPAIDLFNPIYGRGVPGNYTLSAPAISTGETKRLGVFAQDQIIINRYVQALFSGRVDRYDDKGFADVPVSFQDTAASGRAGILLKPREQVSIFASYANSFTRAPLFAQAPAANGPHTAETGGQVEGGVKVEMLQRRLLLTSSVFHINKDNILRADPNFGPAGDNFNAVLPVGKARSTGYEFNLEGFFTSRWYAAFNYALVDTKILRDNVPALIGRPLANAPRHSTGLFTRYNVLRNTGVGFGIEQVSERVEPFAGFRAPGYLIADAALYHDFSSRARLQLQVTNLANSTHALAALFATRVGNFPGQPRAVMLTLTVNPFRR